MSARVKRHKLCRLMMNRHKNIKLRKTIIVNANVDFLCCFAECFYNIIRGNVPFSSAHRKKLQKYKTYVRAMSKKYKTYVRAMSKKYKTYVRAMSKKYKTYVRAMSKKYKTYVRAMSKKYKTYVRAMSKKYKTYVRAMSKKKTLDKKKRDRTDRLLPVGLPTSVVEYGYCSLARTALKVDVMEHAPKMALVDPRLLDTH